jgi:hypothetical protein
MAARTSDLAVTWASPLLPALLAGTLGLLLGTAVVLGSPLSALAALLGVALLLLLLREPRAGLLAMVPLAYLLPFAVIPVRLGFQITALEAILGLTWTVVALRGLVHRDLAAVPAVLWPFTAILFSGLLAFLLSQPYTGPVAEIARRFSKLVLAMLTFPLTLHLVRSAQLAAWLQRSVMLSGALAAALAVGLAWSPRPTMVQILSTLGPLGYPTGESVLRFLPGPNDTYSDVLRATGTSIDPNVLGGVLMLAAALQLSQLFTPRPLLPRWLLLLGGAVTVLGMLLSQSRGSWIGLAAGLLVLATLRYRRIWLALLPVAAAVALLPVGRALFARVVSGFGGQDKAAAMRFDEYRNALEIIQHHPLLGIGFGGPPTIDLAPGVSSQYLTIGETMGLPALAIYLVLLGYLLTRAAGALVLGRLTPWRQGQLGSLLTAITAALVAGVFDHYFSSTAFPHMVALFWMLAALLWRAATPPTADPDPSGDER